MSAATTQINNASTRFDGFTLAELDVAFGKIEPATHWKDPINAIIDYADLKACKAACMFYTATPLSVSGVSCCGKITVTAAGYRAGPAGDH